ncbi:sugar ABC transporter permease [Streptosporangium violaceochromogenes]|nr:sugar ABC transporter permease [Streptosporangium violaceochromogenes]
MTPFGSAPGLRPTKLGVYLFLSVLAVFAAFPLFWMVSTSFKTYEEAYRFPPTLLPRHPSTGAYSSVFDTADLATFAMNSLLVALVATLAGTLFAAMAGYSLARSRFRGRRLLLRSTLLAYIFPQILLVIPLFEVLAKLDLVNTHLGLILAYVTLSFPFSTWMLTAYFRTVPIDIEEAAKVDGASNLRVFWQITLPLVAPGLVAVTVFAFINTWTEFLYSFIILGGGDGRTLSVFLYSLLGGESQQWELLMAASTVAMLPMIILFMAVQRRMASGLASGAVKG